MQQPASLEPITPSLSTLSLLHSTSAQDTHTHTNIHSTERHIHLSCAAAFNHNRNCQVKQRECRSAGTDAREREREKEPRLSTGSFSVRPVFISGASKCLRNDARHSDEYNMTRRRTENKSRWCRGPEPHLISKDS